MGKSSKSQGSTSKADAKFEKKLEFYAKVRDTVASLSAKREITKKNKTQRRQKILKAYDLSSLSEFLPELKVNDKPSLADKLKLNCKSRQKLILTEGKQLHSVLTNPVFQVDPLAAIHQHLTSTQPVPDEIPKKKANKNGSKKRKSKKVKASTGAGSMDI
ncbi:uncharacterized protein LOC110826323 [Carica papaya]|uniref:uncharacterized protein LOC110826323 n=1 Tax=Carica papaya TaxID=3649 RepID=UPI000B8CD38A|nr:uncharacterized protein LOC110826323 [Carica papaya]